MLSTPLIISLIIALLIVISIIIIIKPSKNTPTSTPTPTTTPAPKVYPLFNNVKGYGTQVSNTSYDSRVSGSRGLSTDLINQDVSCIGALDYDGKSGNSVLNSFYLDTDFNSPDNIRYFYNCNFSSDIGSNPVSKSTSSVEDGSVSSFKGDVRRLADIGLDCGVNSGLVDFKLSVDTPNKIKYNYKCLDVPGLNNCRTVSTTPFSDNNGALVSLSRHNILCKDNEVLNSLRLVSNGGMLNYEYKCCSRNN